MDLSRLTDSQYMADQAKQHRAMVEDPVWLTQRYLLLDRLATEWGTTCPTRPKSFDAQPMSTDEFVAIALALHRDSEYSRPSAQFVLLQPWLQFWVLKKWRMEKYIGRRLGVSE